MSPGRWLRSLAAVLGAAALVVAAAGPVRAAYQATADSNSSAFPLNCIGVNDTFPARMFSAALAGFRNLGYATSGYSGTSFTKAQVLSRTPGDWGYYVHSHGVPVSCVIRASTWFQDSSRDSSSDNYDHDHDRCLPSGGTI